MDKFPNDMDLMSSADAFDLASLGFEFGQLPQEEAQDGEDDEPRINPLHDMDSLDFYLWVEEEAAKEVARRKAQAAAQGKPGAEPKTEPEQK
jgi:hypothetical protein